MQRLDVKICGALTREAVDAALSRGASHIGFVHFERSPRHVAIGEIADLVAHVGGRAETVIVAVDPDDELVSRFRATGAGWLQLHGRETPERVAAIRAASGLKVMKALPVSEATDLAAIAAYQPVADRLLLDSRRPKGSDLPGGNGVSFDWRIVQALDPSLDYMLSGGIDAKNVADAIRIAAPSGIDISSGVESAPGVKDISLIHAFFDAVESAGSAHPVRKAERS